MPYISQRDRSTLKPRRLLLVLRFPIVSYIWWANVSWEIPYISQSIEVPTSARDYFRPTISHRIIHILNEQTYRERWIPHASKPDRVTFMLTGIVWLPSSYDFPPRDNGAAGTWDVGAASVKKGIWWNGKTCDDFRKWPRLYNKINNKCRNYTKYLINWIIYFLNHKTAHVF